LAIPDAAAIEAAGLKAWPALEMERDGAWVLRAANGYTKRANSVQAMNPADDENAAARLKYATEWFKARGLPAVFRGTPLTGRKTRAALREAKWEEFDDSVVLVAELPRPPQLDPRAEFYDVRDPAFHGVQKALQEYDDATTQKLGSVLWMLGVPAAGVVLRVYERPVASALVAVADGIAIAGNVITAKAERGNGFARSMMQSGLAWAFEQGARTAALNMAADNAAASRLYQGLGYRHAYDYSYYKAPA
jgi:RimJ/RimL family protein N-acetyltransferase